jgi:PhnB protein
MIFTDVCYDARMSIKQLTPYLNFNGTAHEAIKLYQSALGAQLGGDPMPFEKDASRVMHARLQIGGGMVMLSDSMPGQPVPESSNQHITLDYSDVNEMKRAFEALSAGGKVTMPLQDTFWGATFGMLTDRFHINWMFNCDKPKS